MKSSARAHLAGWRHLTNQAYYWARQSWTTQAPGVRVDHDAYWCKEVIDHDRSFCFAVRCPARQSQAAIRQKAGFLQPGLAMSIEYPSELMFHLSLVHWYGA